MPLILTTGFATQLSERLTYYRQLGIRVRRLLTDNGPCYRSGDFARLCLYHNLIHRRTRPYTPRTNGKAERFIQTALREWAYACPYSSSKERAEYFNPWLHQYNWHIPHASLAMAPPICRSGLTRNNLLIHHN